MSASSAASEPARARRAAGWLLVLLVVVAFGFQGSRGLWEPDEGRYSTVALNMLESGDWIVPQLHSGHPHLTKPPLTYWAIAASIAVFGVSEWALRLPMALAFVCTGLLVHQLGRRLVPDRPWLPALIWCLSPLPVVVGNIVSTDTLLALFATLAMLGFVAAWAAPPGARRGWIRLMWLGFGLAFMSKGPPGLLPLAAAVAYCACHDRRLLREMADPLGLLAFALVASSWFGVLIARDPARLGYFLGYEVVDRIFTDAHARNPAWYAGFAIYLPTLLVGTLPWWPLALAAVGGPRHAWRALRARWNAADRGWQLLGWWLLLPLAVFFLARSRLPTYLLPLSVPLALALARPLARWPWLTRRRLAAIAAFTALALLALKGLAPRLTHDRDARAIAAQISASADLAQVEEIVFVSMPPQYGLRVYLGKPIEDVKLGPSSHAHAREWLVEDVCTELARGERRLYAMKSNRDALFRQAAADCGTFRVERVGEYHADDVTVLLFKVVR